MKNRASFYVIMDWKRLETDNKSNAKGRINEQTENLRL